jgi:hypothetical protein
MFQNVQSLRMALAGGPEEGRRKARSMDTVVKWRIRRLFIGPKARRSLGLILRMVSRTSDAPYFSASGNDDGERHPAQL